MQPTIFNMLKAADSITDRDQKIQFLRVNSNQAVWHLLKIAYDPEIHFLLPKDVPPYRVSEHPENENNLPQQVKNLFYLINISEIPLTPAKREQLFIRTLESVSKEDALLLLCVKDKRLPFPSITPELVNETFPGLLSRVVDRGELKNVYEHDVRTDVQPQDLNSYLKSVLEGEPLFQTPIESEVETVIEGNLGTVTADDIVRAVTENLVARKPPKRKAKGRGKAATKSRAKSAKPKTARAKPKAKKAKKPAARKAKRVIENGQVV